MFYNAYLRNFFFRLLLNLINLFFFFILIFFVLWTLFTFTLLSLCSILSSFYRKIVSVSVYYTTNKSINFVSETNLPSLIVLCSIFALNSEAISKVLSFSSIPERITSKEKFVLFKSSIGVSLLSHFI